MNNISKVKLSVRRIAQQGVPGDDPSLFNIKIGASLKGNTPLKGVDYNEEEKYLPEIIGYSPKDPSWRRMVKDYWNNISVVVPADGTTTNELHGKPINFSLRFKNKENKEEFEALSNFEKMGQKLAELHKSDLVEVVENIEDYILFRYCLVYSRVANSVDLIGMSPKIRFYLYSTTQEVKAKHKLFKQRSVAKSAFFKLLNNEETIDALLRMFGENPDTFKGLEFKHLALEVYVDRHPEQFIQFTKDANLELKSLIKRAAEVGVIKNPVNTDNYYYGDNNEVLLGKSVDDVVLFMQDDSERNQQIAKAIKANLKNL